GWSWALVRLSRKRILRVLLGLLLRRVVFGLPAARYRSARAPFAPGTVRRGGRIYHSHGDQLPSLVARTRAPVLGTGDGAHAVLCPSGHRFFRVCARARLNHPAALASLADEGPGPVPARYRRIHVPARHSHPGFCERAPGHTHSSLAS